MLYGLLIAAAVEGIWKGDLVVRFLPLSFYAKKKVAERKARIRGGGAKDARMREHMAAPVPPSYVSPPITAQPIATVFVYTRNGRRVRRLPFLKEKYYVCCFSFSRLQSAYTLCRSLSNILNLSCLAVWTSAFAINAKHVFFAVPCIIYCHRRYLVLSAAECAS